MICDVINALQGFIMFCVVFFDRENVRRIRTKFGELRLIELESTHSFTITLANNVISRWAAWILCRSQPGFEPTSGSKVVPTWDA